MRDVVGNLNPLFVKNLQFIHAWSGHASGISIRKKTALMKMAENKNNEVLKLCEAFNSMEVAS